MLRRTTALLTLALILFAVAHVVYADVEERPGVQLPTGFSLERQLQKRADKIIVVQLDRADVSKAMGNLGVLYTHARMVPHFHEGKNAGFKFLAVAPDGLFYRMGLRQRDLWLATNEIPLEIKNGADSLRSLQKNDLTRLLIYREGKFIEIRVEVK